MDFFNNVEKTKVKKAISLNLALKTLMLKDAVTNRATYYTVDFE
jgi:hypothetical protein